MKTSRKNLLVAIPVLVSMGFGVAPRSEAQPSSPTRSTKRAIPACNSKVAKDGAHTMKFEPVTSVEHLMTQIRDAAKSGHLCIDPRKWEDEWRIPIFQWRPLAGLPEHPVEFDAQRKAIPAAGPLGEMMVSVFEGGHGRPPRLRIDFRAGLDAGREVISFQRLRDLFGSNPALNKTELGYEEYSMPRSGPHPNFNATWDVSLDGYSVTAGFTASSRLGEITITFRREEE
jgi:hypothetical protein